MTKTIDSTGREYTGRARAHQERRRAQVCFLMDQELFDEILNQCRVEGVSRSGFIRRACNNELAKVGIP